MSTATARLALLLLVLGCARPAATPAAPEPVRPLRFGADVHQHLTLGEAVPLYSGEPGDPQFFARGPRHAMFNQLQPEALEAAGVRLVFATLWAPPALRPTRDALDETLDQARKLEAFARRRPPFALAHDVASARALLAKGKLVAIPALEGAEAVSSVEDVDRLYAAGIRVIGLVHFFDNGLADAEDDQFGGLAGLIFNGRDFGLSEKGRAAVRRMFELGILVDLAHASERAMHDTLALAEEAGVAVLYSHAGGAVGHPRTLPDELAVRIARTGGLIGVGIYWSDLLMDVPEQDRFPGFVSGTCDEAIAHYLHFVRLVGAEHVVLGSDFSSVIQRGGAGGHCRDGVRNAFDLPAFFAGLEAEGLPREALDDSGERVLRVLERLERHASAAARDRASRVPLPAPRSLFDVPL